MSYEKNIEYIKTLISELGKEKAKEEYLESIIYDLDILGKKHASDDIFHLTANEITNSITTLEFIQEHKEETQGTVKEILEYLEEIMQEEKNKYPYELLGEFFDNIK